MSFLLQSVTVPLIILLILIAASTPVFIKLYKMFHRRFISTGKLQKTFEEVVDATETQFQAVRKATHRIASKTTKKQKSQGNGSSQKKTESHAMEKKVLQVLAEKKDSGMLDRSIADILGLDTSKTKQLLGYLEAKKFIESVNGIQGVKFYLTQFGKTYCQKKGYLD